jgi:arylsulfatase A-like enzyme
MARRRSRGRTTPFRSEKNSNWEGGYRVPAFIRWPDVVKPQTEVNGIFSSEDWVPTLMAAAGQPDITEKLLNRYDANGKTFKVHLDGYDQHDLLSGGDDKRREFFYWTDDGDLAGLRYDQWKIVFLEQQHEGLRVWQEPLVALRAPLVFNLRSDPFEKANIESGEYEKWYVERMFLMAPAQAIVGKEIQTLKEFPPRQKPGSFSVGDALEKLQNAGQNSDN